MAARTCASSLRVCEVGEVSTSAVNHRRVGGAEGGAVLRAYGWAVLRSRTPTSTAAGESADPLEDHDADRRLARPCQGWMDGGDWPFVKWRLVEENNNDRAVLIFSVSKNHSSPELHELLQWVVQNGPGATAWCTSTMAKTTVPPSDRAVPIARTCSGCYVCCTGSSRRSTTRSSVRSAP